MARTYVHKSKFDWLIEQALSLPSGGRVLVPNYYFMGSRCHLWNVRSSLKARIRKRGYEKQLRVVTVPWRLFIVRK